MGKWKSLDDPKSIMEFTPYDLISYYDGELIERQPYGLSPKCMNESEVNRNISEQHDYISFIESDMCFYIVAINETHLTLSYTAQGNTLEFQKE